MFKTPFTNPVTNMPQFTSPFCFYTSGTMLTFMLSSNIEFSKAIVELSISSYAVLYILRSLPEQCRLEITTQWLLRTCKIWTILMAIVNLIWFCRSVFCNPSHLGDWALNIACTKLIWRSFNWLWLSLYHQLVFWEELYPCTRKHYPYKSLAQILVCLTLFGFVSRVAGEMGSCFSSGFLQFCSLVKLLLKASNLFALSTSSLVPRSVITQGISRPPSPKSLEYFLLGSATLHDITPPFPINNKQVELIFSANGQQWPQLSSPLWQKGYVYWQVHDSTKAFHPSLASIHLDRYGILKHTLLHSVHGRHVTVRKTAWQYFYEFLSQLRNYFYKNLLLMQHLEFYKNFMLRKFGASYTVAM